MLLGHWGGKWSWSRHSLLHNILRRIMIRVEGPVTSHKGLEAKYLNNQLQSENWAMQSFSFARNISPTLLFQAINSWLLVGICAFSLPGSWKSRGFENYQRCKNWLIILMTRQKALHHDARLVVQDQQPWDGGRYLYHLISSYSRLNYRIKFNSRYNN